ncbi:MAG TPA: 3-deoxy-manno-octulosonate cytidylyltransferase [Sphingomicrobium sp.]|nr:3-deoxy-manno-octulosonate cytidylyltransferase [Sphingomicrobium sp.]
MKAAILIPARFASSRYPGKPLVALKGVNGEQKPLIQRSFEAARRVPGIAEVHVVTDDERIAETVRGFGGSALMTSETARNGTERCAEALDQLADDIDVIVNFQGDALLTPPGFVTALIDQLATDPGADVATPAIRQRVTEVRKLQAEEAAGRVGGTSVVIDGEGRALYFSKKLIPFLPDRALDREMSPVRLHIGVYAYRRSALTTYVATPPSELEDLEGLEQLRFLVAGIPVHVVEVETPPFTLRELNNPEDVSPIEDALAMAGLE